jgi:8-oxo-dGTP pyrophosphatase MutT (NUDIX family)
MDFISYFKTLEINEADHLAMLPVGRTLSSEALEKMDSHRESAVGIHCYKNHDAHYEILLIQRSEYQGKHSGQIAFPGGKMEIDDPDLVHTARRECFEEVGISMHEGDLIRSLSPVYIPVSNFKMTPYFFYHEKCPTLQLNEREVQQIIPLSLESLAHQLPIEHRTLEIEVNSLFTREVPGFSHGPHWIWGATALVLQQLRIAYSDYSKQFHELS